MHRSNVTTYFISFCVLASLLFLLPANSSAAQTEITLLKSAPTATGAITVQKPINTSLVSRTRTVDINSDALNIQSIDSVQLNLFDDAQYRASRVRSQRGTGGALLWTGTISGTDKGHVVIVVKDRKVCASISLASTMYQVRPIAQGLHVVRQVRKEALSGVGSIPSAVSQSESKVIQLVNQERLIEGLRPLQYNDRLYSSARNHSRDMALANYYSHDSRNGRKFFERIFASGYPVSKCGENIAHGFSTPEEVFEGWMNSPDHRVNIMNAEFTEIGVGYASNDTTHREYWTQDFGAGRKGDTGQGIRLAGGSFSVQSDRSRGAGIGGVSRNY